MRSAALRTGAVCTGLALVVLALLRHQVWAFVRWVPQWAQMMQAYMATSLVAFSLGQVVVAASGILPASLIAIMAGASFGFVWGLGISVGSTMLGGWVAFLLSRSILRPWIERLVCRHSAMRRLDQGMTQEGWRLVMLLRVSPVMPFAMTSYGLGLTQISQRNFLLGTMASLPALVGYVAVGVMGKSGLLLANGQGSPWRWLPIIAGVAIVFYALSRLRRAMERAATA